MVIFDVASGPDNLKTQQDWERHGLLTDIVGTGRLMNGTSMIAKFWAVKCIVSGFSDELDVKFVKTPSIIL